MTIGKKLGMLVGILLILFLTLGLVAYIQIRQIDSSMIKITEVKEPTSAAAYEMEINLVGTGFDLLGYLHDHNQARLDQIRRNNKSFEEFQKKYDALADTKKGKDLGARVDKSYGEFKMLADELTAIENEQTKKMEALLDNFAETDKVLDERIQDSITSSEPNSYQKLKYALEMEIYTNGIAKSLGNYLRTHQLHHERRVRKEEKYFQNTLAAYRSLNLSSTEKEWAGHIEKFFLESTQLAKEIIRLDRAKEEGLAKLVDLRKEMDRVLDSEIRSLARADLESAKKVSRRTVTTAAVVILFLVIAGITAGFVSSTVITRSITGPIKKLKAAAAEIGGGRLDTKIDIRAEDEIGDLAKSFSRMTEDLKNTQAILIQTEKLSALGELGAGVAHELNNPLTGVMSMVKTYMTEKDQQSEEYQDLKTIEEACHHMAKIIEDFTAFTRPSAEEFGPVDLSEIIKSIVSFSAPTLKKKDIEIKQNYGENLPPVRGNKNQLQQVIANMITNARDAISEKGTITITTRAIPPLPSGERAGVRGLPSYNSSPLEGEDKGGGGGVRGQPPLPSGERAGVRGEFVEMSFTDTGCGISKEHIDKIFDPFFTSKRPGRGIGLGLSIVHTIIKAHKGKITVDSEVGKGTTFTIHLPIN